MTDAISVGQLTERQRKLQDVFEAAQQAMWDSQKAYELAKAELVAFNGKFGRVLEMMKED